MLRREAREHRRWITKPSAILLHRICIADAYTSIADFLLMCRRCVWDIFGLGVHRRMFADCSPLFGDISSMVFDVEKSGENFNACIEIFLNARCLGEAWRLLAYIADHSPNHWCMVALPKCVHRESIGRLKKPRGTVAL